jgi:ABC-type oligopeptide transport system substrate-binding subunit
LQEEKEMKKFAMFAIIATALALIVAACGPAATPPPPPTAVPQPTTAPAQPTAAPAQPTAAPAQPTAAPAQPTAVPPTAAPTTAPAAAGPKVLRIGSGTFPDVFDPQKSSFVNEIEVLQLAYEGLLGIDAKGNIGPGAADTWELSDDAMSMTFHIRDGLKRADGTAMTCADFEYALKREVDPRVPGKQYTSIVYDIKGAEELDALASEDPASIDAAAVEEAYKNYGVTCTDASNLKVEFKKPTGFWDYVAYTWVVYPAAQAAVDADPDAWWTKVEGHNGNGPYKFSEIIDGQKIVFTANENYWKGKPKIERIELIYTNDTQLLFEAYKKGELEMTFVAPEWLQEVEGDATLKSEFLRYPAATTSGMTYNHADPRFQDKNVRIAFSQAMDRPGWVNDVLKGIGKEYTRWIPPGVPGYQDKPGVPDTDLAAAKKTLAENGYGAADSTADAPKLDCAKLGDLKITYAASTLNHARFQFVAGNMVRALGCPVTLDPVDPTVMTALTKDPKTFPLLSRQGWIQDYPHPSNWLSVYFTCNGFAARSSYCNEDFDKLTQEADASTNFEEAVKLYQQAEDTLMADVPTAFTNYGEYLYLVKPYIVGINDNLGSSDAAWPGQFGPVGSYDIDLTKVGEGYPTN